MAKRTLVILLFLTSAIPTFAQNKDAIIGKWLTASEDAQIQIYAAGSNYSGRIVWLKKPKDNSGKLETDDKNPNLALAKRPLIGLEMLRGFAYVDDGVWQGGTIYDPKTGKTYSCKISMVNKNQLHVRGFVGISLLGRTETWSRIR